MHVNSVLTEESVVSITAWAVPGLAAGTLAKTLIRGRGSPGFAVTGATGVTGALLSGRLVISRTGHRTAWL